MSDVTINKPGSCAAANLVQQPVSYLLAESCCLLSDWGYRVSPLDFKNRPLVLIYLSIMMTKPHQSGTPFAQFVGERVFQTRGVCGQAFPSFLCPTPFVSPFCSRPIFRVSRMRKTNTRGPNFVHFVRERLLCRLAFSRPRSEFSPIRTCQNSYI